MKLISQQDNVFNPKYYGEKSEQQFNTQFRQVNNTGSDIELDEIIIFDGGDINGYPENNKNHI